MCLSWYIQSSIDINNTIDSVELENKRIINEQRTEQSMLLFAMLEKEKNKEVEYQNTVKEVWLATDNISRGSSEYSIYTKIIALITQRDIDYQQITDYEIKNQIANLIISESKKYNINPLLIASIIDVESNFRLDCQSYAGAIGIMQIMPSTAKWVAEQMELESYDLYNFKDNIKIGVYYYAKGCLNAWEGYNITQIHPKTNNLLTAEEMALLTYNGGIRLAKTLKNINYLYAFEESYNNLIK